jgi:hypothetical protein
MAYAVIDVELSSPLPAIALRPEENGVGLLLRLHGRPIGWLVRGLERGGRLEPAALGSLVAEEAGLRLLCDAVAAEIAPAGRDNAEGGEPVVWLGDGAVRDAHWAAGLAEARAEQPDAALVCGPVVPVGPLEPAEIASERAPHVRFEKLRAAPGVPGPLTLAAAEALAAVGSVVVRPDVARAIGPPGDAGIGVFVARALAAGHVVAYEPGLLVRRPGGRDPDALAAGARRHGAAVVALLSASRGPARRRAVARRTVRWLALEAGSAAAGKRAGALRPRSAALAELAGGLSAAAGGRGAG